MAESSQLPVPKVFDERQTFVGLSRRAAAFLIDIVLIYFAGYTLALGLRTPLMELGPWLPLLSTFGAFCYFWLGNGPIGGGATLGKAILNLRTVTADEDPPKIPGYGRAFRRALLQFPLIYLALFQFVRITLDLPPQAGALGDAVVRTLVIALLFTYGYSMITHPQKATWYDLWSGVRVTPDPTPSDPPGKLEARFAGESDRKSTAHRAFSRYFFIAVCVVFGMAMAPILRDPYRAANLHLIQRVQATTPLEGYELEGMAYRSARDYDLWRGSFSLKYQPVGTDASRNYRRPEKDDSSAEDLEEGLRVGEPAEAPDEATTYSTLTQSSTEPGSGMRPGQAILFMSWVKKRGEAVPTDTLELESQLEALRAASERYATDRKALGIKPEAPAPTRIVCALSDRFRFVVFSPSEGLSGIIQGPIDPEEGPLTHAWYEPAP